MDAAFAPALIVGVERVTAWADLLDEINVFPVADGDTGRNLVVSLAPLRRIDRGREATVREPEMEMEFSIPEEISRALGR